MKKQEFNYEFNRLIVGFTNPSAPKLVELDADFYKKLWQFVLMGDSYFFIINHQIFAFEFVSKEVLDVLGYDPHEFTLLFLNDKIHPDDRSWFLTFGNRVNQFFAQLPTEKFMKYKVRFDIRVMKSNGEFARILYQGILIEYDDKGKFLRTLNIHTDITHLKKDGVPVLSFIGMEGEPSYYDVASDNAYIASKEELTIREKQILKLLIEGKPSKEISQLLSISKQTVDTHRKNMIHKKNLSNTSELIGKAIRHGWI